MPTLALLDGHSLAYRAFFALPPDLATASGQVTNSVYGFTRMLLKLISEHHPEAIAVTWDVSRDTFRTQAYEDYKSNRTAAPDAFRSQLPLIREVLDALGYPQLQEEGYEADDVIASVAAEAVARGWEVMVVTGDRDSFQLVDDHVQVLYTRRGISDTVLADRAWVEERYGVRPDQYTDYAALRGDTSDNLPGVPGVGEKTAAKLVGGYGSLEGIYEHLDEQTPRLRENLAAARDQVFLNRQLIRLVDDLEVGVEPSDLARRPWDRDATKKLFESLEFHSLFDELADLWGESAVVGEVLEVEVHRLVDQERVAELARHDPLVVEPVWDEGIVGLCIPESDHRVAFVPWESAEPILAAIGDQGVATVLHDGKDLVREIVAQGRAVEGLTMDTALAAYVLQPASRAYDLDELAARYLGVELVSPDRATDEGAQPTLDFDGGPDLEEAGRRTVVVGRLAGALRDELEQRDESELFDRMEAPLVPVLARMEAAGIGVDRGYLEELGESLRDQLDTLERDIHREAGEPFNINSTNQLREVLFERLQLPVLKKTAKGVPSTDASVLSKLADAHPIVAHLLRYRELEKLRSTYVDGYLPLISADGRIHTRFNQMAAATGRLSSDRPNLQNIPVRSETGRTVRRAFIPRPGWTFIIADYSQIELRVLAHLSGDPGLVEAFLGDETDVHTATAARVFGLRQEDVTPEMRRRAKVINFGLLYGMEAFGLADRLEISREEAREHIDAYFRQFPQVQEFMQGAVTEARNRGYTTTLFGRRRYLPELQSDNFRVRQMGERMALNAPVQGTAADIIKLAMIELDRRLRQRRAEATLLLQIHDELLLEAPPAELEEASSLVASVMEGVADLAVPLRVDLATGDNLADCKP